MIWLTGHKGLLGKAISKQLTENSIQFISSGSEINISDLSIIKNFTHEHKISLIINCAAYTNVNLAETEVEEAYKVNSKGIENLGQIAASHKAGIIHFSTDYVYDGKNQTPYLETNPTNPLSIYGKSKLEGEKALLAATNKALIIRISWLYGFNENNFVKKILNNLKQRKALKVINDQFGSPTYAEKLAQQVVKIIKENNLKPGIYHYQDKGKISWFDFAQKIHQIATELKIIKDTPPPEAVDTSYFPTIAIRPEYSVLNTEKIQQELGIEILKWDENLRAYLELLK
jgi:dTDP-4-dehydrorhamnose reductase